MTSNTEQLVSYIHNTQWQDLSAEAISKTKMFVLDSVAVGICGSRITEQVQLIESLRAVDGLVDTSIWGTEEKLGAASAAMINAWQIHNQEFDCVHEKAVVHPMAVILGTLLSVAESMERVSGKQFITAINIAVDVATVLGMCAIKPMRFFRPAMCGAIGAAAGLSKLLGLNKEQIHNALGITYSHLSGTMQAHLEGSPTLAYQIGLNARAAVTCSLMARQNLKGPKDFLEGEFGYFALIEGEWDTKPFKQLGIIWQITQVSHKPFPTGRAAHGALDGLVQLQQKYGFEPAEIQKIIVQAPPLILRLVDRPMMASMNTSYAKLCLGFIVAVCLTKGRIEVTDYNEELFANSELLAIAEKLEMLPNKVDDPNALSPQSVMVRLTSGKCYQIDLHAILGAPERALTREMQIEKFYHCIETSDSYFSFSQTEQLINIIDGLEQLKHIGLLTSLMIPNKES